VKNLFKVVELLLIDVVVFLVNFKLLVELRI